MKEFNNLKDAMEYAVSAVREYDSHIPLNDIHGIIYIGGIQNPRNGQYFVTERNYQVCVLSNMDG